MPCGMQPWGVGSSTPPGLAEVFSGSVPMPLSFPLVRGTSVPTHSSTPAMQVVVFLLQHGPAGSLGLILNRPTSLKMGRGRGGLPMSLDVSLFALTQLLQAADRRTACSRTSMHASGCRVQLCYLASTRLAALVDPALSRLMPLCLPVLCTLQGMPELRDAFASSVLYCGGFKAQHIVTLLHGQRRLEGAVEVRWVAGSLGICFPTCLACGGNAVATQPDRGSVGP